MATKAKGGSGPIGRCKVVPDFLPPPAKLAVLKAGNRKIEGGRSGGAMTKSTPAPNPDAYVAALNKEGA